jgi:enoyl-CoA hydratase/carnithine racemase
MSGTGAVRIDRRSDALWLILDRPDRSNAISPEVIEGLDSGLAEAEADAAIKSVVVSATGPVFCAGADLKHVRSLLAAPSSGPDSPMGAFLRRVGRTLDRLERLPKPVLAAVQGPAIAGGLELVLCCDIVIAARSASFADGHAKFGFIPGGGASVRLSRRIGASRAKHLMFTGRSVSAEQLLGTDLVNEVVDDADLANAATRLTDELAARSPLGLQRMKQLAADAWDTPLDAALRTELDQAALHERSHDMAEGLSAFAEKRQPIFVGR